MRALPLAADRPRETLGDSFDLDGIGFLMIEAVLAGELAAVASRWLLDTLRPTQAADALVVAASALRLATWLWLEDDDRAMACLRVVVEQIARSRVWRAKPTRAAALEAKARTTPRDRLETAGWRRLSLLKQAIHLGAPDLWDLRVTRARCGWFAVGQAARNTRLHHHRAPRPASRPYFRALVHVHPAKPPGLGALRWIALLLNRALGEFAHFDRRADIPGCSVRSRRAAGRSHIGDGALHGSDQHTGDRGSVARRRGGPVD